ncbi:MAG: M16 family metallopeptidase, partial [Vampirovibrionales bacterium]
MFATATPTTPLSSAPPRATATSATVVSTTPFALPYLKEQGSIVKFNNGHTLIFVPRQGDVFNVSTWVKTGSLHEDAQNNGVSHFLEHLMFKGSDRFAPGVFDRAMESMGGVINAATWKDYTFYYITGPNTAYGEFATALDMHADMLLHSTLPEDEIGPAYDPDKGETPSVKRERGVVIEEIGMCEDRPWTKVYNAVNEMMYPAGHPYRREVIGTRHIVGTIPREQILAYYRRWYAPQTMTTVVVGNFELESLTQQVAEAFNFGAITNTAEALKVYTEPPADAHWASLPTPTVERYQELQGDYDTRFVIKSWHGPKLEDKKAGLALSVASHILGESRSSRLHLNLVEKQTPSKFTTLGTTQYAFKLGIVFFVQGNFIASDVPAALAEIDAELAAVLGDAPITQAEFDRTVKKLKTDFARSVETSAGLADNLGESYTLTDDVAFFTSTLDELKELTLADV